MAIEGFDRDAFEKRLATVVFPAQPIQSIEHLFGRAGELDRIKKALVAPGRQVFIYGDRGVGKSSLAATAANQYQSVDAEYIDVSCGPGATLRSVVANIAYQAVNASRIRSKTTQTKYAFDAKYLRAERSETDTLRDIANEIETLPDAVEVLREVALVHSEKPIVVIDEFDRMDSKEERNLFADLLKHIGDKRIPIKLIFTGVAKTLDELLGAHQSAIRQLETIELPKLSWDARWDIALHATRAFDLTLDRNIYVRIAAVSDGYPYYVHLVTEKLLWRIFDDDEVIKTVTWDHYYDALREAIKSISAELKRPYEKAIYQRSGDYEPVLWSTADSEDLQLDLKDMYSSYQYIMKQIHGAQPLDYNKYSSRIRSLKTPTCGAILVSDIRPGLYTYREKMFRGYVRMQAEANRIELIGEQDQAREKQYMHTPRAKTGYYHSIIPKGVHTGRRRDDKK